MNSPVIIITGANGFVGKNLLENYHGVYKFIPINRETINTDLVNKFSEGNTVIHLAGIAHDLKKLNNDSKYFEVNTELTIKVFKEFLKSKAEKFIFLSSVKAVLDQCDSILTENVIPNPLSVYGKSKQFAESFIVNHIEFPGKKIYILRPSMIHGPQNKGNLNLLFNFVTKGLPWPLGEFNNKRSFCSIDNLSFIIRELIDRNDIPAGIYNVADDTPLSTNELIKIVAESLNMRIKLLKINKSLVRIFFKIGDFLHLQINSSTLQKLTENYVVSNLKIKVAIGKPLPLSSREGLLKTFKSFKGND